MIGTGFGSSTNVTTVAIQGDGKILVGGQFSTYSGVTHNGIIRLNTDGTIDNTFVIGTGFNSIVATIAIQGDGKILVGGVFATYSGSTHGGIIRLNTDGSIDNTFVIGTGFGSGTGPLTMSIQGDGKILCGGSFISYNAITKNYIIRLNTDGSIDNTFVIGSGFNNTVYAMSIQGDGKILVGGSFTLYNGVTKNYIIRLTSLGNFDYNFISLLGFNNNVKVIENSGSTIFVGGQFTTYENATNVRLLKLTSSGTLDNYSKYFQLPQTPYPLYKNNTFGLNIINGLLSISSLEPIQYATISYTLIAHYGGL